MAPTISVVIVSKDEPGLDATLSSIPPRDDIEVVVVDASAGRLDWIAEKHSGVNWIRFEQPPGKRFSIPDQRNIGIKNSSGEVIEFIDSGCRAAPGWCDVLAEPILTGGELVTAGKTTRENTIHAGPNFEGEVYVAYAPTINLAIARSVFEVVGPFDESFVYGSDLDLSWRLGAAGIRIRHEPAALVEPDWGSTKRQLKRSYRYGKAKPVLYRKHHPGLKGMYKEDPIPFIYATAMVAILVVRDRRWTAATCAAAVLRNRHSPRPWLALGDHVIFTFGFVVESLRPSVIRAAVLPNASPAE